MVKTVKAGELKKDEFKGKDLDENVWYDRGCGSVLLSKKEIIEIENPSRGLKIDMTDIGLVAFIFISIMTVIMTITTILGYTEYLNYMLIATLMGGILFALGFMDKDDLFFGIVFGPIIICSIVLVAWSWGIILN